MGKRKKRLSVPERLKAYDVMLTNALLPDILAKLSVRGVNENYIATRRSLRDSTQELDVKQENDYLQLKSKSTRLKQLRRASSNTFSGIAKEAKLLGRHFPVALERLGLVKALPKNTNARLDFAKNLYGRLLIETELLAVVAPKGLTETRITEANTELSVTLGMDKEVADLEGIAQSTTHERDRQIERLDDMMMEMVELAKVALTDNPQQLERLGVIVK